MIPLNFYRDDDYVYYNNPNGITKKMTIADFESMMSNESELPEYSSSSQGKVLSVDSDGDLEWASLPPDELPAYSSSNQGEVLSVDSDGDLEWASLPPAELPAYTSSDGGKVLAVNSGGTGVEWVEESGGSSALICTAILSETTLVLDKTFAEIKAAILAGLGAYILAESDGESSYSLIYGYTEDPTNNRYHLYCSSRDFSTWSGSSASAYPSFNII